MKNCRNPYPQILMFMTSLPFVIILEVLAVDIIRLSRGLRRIGTILETVESVGLMRNRLELEVLIYYGFEEEDELVQSGKKKKIRVI